MHPSLSLARLSGDLQKTASAVLGGDTEGLKNLYGTTPATERVNLLAVYYAGLGGDTISQLLARLDDAPDAVSATNFFEKKISFALECLRGILRLDIDHLLPPLAASDLWLRLWPCIHLLDAYSGHFPAISALSDKVALYDLFLSIILLIRRHDGVTSLVDATPAVRTVVVRGWTFFMENSDLVGAPTLERLGNYLARALNFLDERLFEEAVEGSGNRTNLAALVVKTVKHTNSAVQNLSNVPALSIVMQLVAAMRARCKLDAALQEALIRQGIAQHLAATACLFATEAASDFFDTCIFAVTDYLLTPYGPGAIVQALHGGLLRAIFMRGRQAYTAKTQKFVVNTMLTLTASLVYLSVLLELQVAVRDPLLGVPVNEDSFKGFPLCETWRSFWTTLLWHWSVMKSHLKSARQSMRACDTIECGALKPKSDFQRCAGCSTMVYCSEHCQLRDWRGGHRHSCPLILELRRSEPTNVAAKDKSFLRTLIHADYLRLKEKIIASGVQIMRKNPHNTSVFTVFDYSSTHIPCEISIGPVNRLGGEWADYVSRAAKSGGRMQLHIMRVRDGRFQRQWLFPLRSASPEIFEGMRLISGNSRMTKEVEDRRVKDLLKLNIYEVH
ncbi:hypothetical protein DFH06DRAFT_1219298 [Mycena polygramma]|nr:hypothetical protein DFH06DRAFT_1219298 [Mycena polygramma]